MCSNEQSWHGSQLHIKFKVHYTSLHVEELFLWITKWKVIFKNDFIPIFLLEYLGWIHFKKISIMTYKIHRVVLMHQTWCKIEKEKRPIYKSSIAAYYSFLTEKKGSVVSLHIITLILLRLPNHLFITPTCD